MKSRLITLVAAAVMAALSHPSAAQTRGDDQLRQNSAKAKRAEQLRRKEAELAETLGYNREPQAPTWGTQLIAAIQKHWVRPNIGNQAVRKIVLNIVMDRTGAVRSVAIRESSGDSRIDHACMEAAIAASPLPLPRDPSIFQPSINVTFIPR